MRTVAILCASPRSVYTRMAGVEVYTPERDAWTFRGGMPVVAHPPCRVWSRYTRHQAKPGPDEERLGIWCAAAVEANGGILEQPAHSHLWARLGLPEPGLRARWEAWSTCVWQAWWGYPMRKATWLYFRGIPPPLVRTPLRLHPAGGDRAAEKRMSDAQRSATTPAFAEWLVELARRSRVGPGSALSLAVPLAGPPREQRYNQGAEGLASARGNRWG